MYPLHARFVLLPAENVDTDQIIPARFLKTTSRDGLGPFAFYDWRYDAAGKSKRDFVFNRAESAGAQVLVAGHNFGCGSSREHAPWALLGLGLRAVISSAFADIFRNNALKNGLLPIQVSPTVLAQLLRVQGEINIDLEAQTIQTPSGIFESFPIDPFAKHCLLNGVDQLGFLLSVNDDITTYEQSLTTVAA